MKSKRLLILLLMALLVPWAANAQTLTVADGGNTNSNIPFKSYYQDYAQRCDYVIPADSLTAMVGKSITSVTLYPSYSLTVNGASVYFKVVTDSQITSTSFSGSDGTLVYTGSLSLATSGMVIPVNDYLYNGGNLLIGIYKNSGGSYPTGTFSGKNTSSSIYPSLYAYSSSATSWTSITTGSKYNFMPKTTFTYQTPPTCPKPTFTANNVTTNALTANLTWTAGGTETQWAVAHALTANAEPDDNIIDNAVNTLPTETAPYAVPNLALGDHYFWVRANCDATDQSDWVGPVQVHIGYCTPNPSSRDNKGITAVSFGTGNYIMDTSNANGLPASSPYYADYTFKVGGVPAGMTALVNISYTTGYNYGTLIWVDWNNNLAFEDSEIVFAGQSSDIAQPSGTHELEASFSIPSTQAQGDYRMRIAGADSYFDPYISNPSGTGAHSACFSSTYAVCHDYTLRVLEQPSCMPVSALTVDEANVTDTQIPISWTPGGTEDSWNIRWRKYGTTDTYSTATVTTNSYTISGLTANTKYEFGVQAGCDTLNMWTEGNYTTECGVEASIHENFDSYTGTTSGSTNNLPHCWDYYNGTTYSYNAGYPLIYSGSSYSGSNHLRFYSYYSSSYTYTDQYAILPAVVNVSAMRVSLMARLNTNYSGTPYPGELVVGVMTDPDDLTTFTALDTIKPTTSYKPFTVNLDSYTGTGNRIALKMTPATSSQTYRYVMVDNLVVEVIPDCETPTGLALKSGSQTPEGATIVWNPGNASSWFVEYKKNSESEYTAIATPVADTFYTFMGLDANTPYNARIKVNCTTGAGITYPTDPVSFTTDIACPAPKKLVVTGIAVNQAVLSWTPGYDETEWTVKYKVSDSTTYITAPTVSGTPTITLTGLDGGTSYDVQIIGCDVANVYTVTRAFTTAFTAPYLQAFAASSIPAGWNNYSTLLAPEVLNGTTPLSGSGSWIFSNTNVFGAYHAKLNIYGDNCKSWLLTPNIVVGSGQVLSFDLALTDYSYETPIEDTTAQSDDKFIVLVSTNNGTTWSILRQWNNAGSEYVYNRIATTGETVYIDLAGFSGQTVRVAFYGESTIAGNGDNDLHIDNVSIDLPPTCYRPIGLTASDVTNHSAKLSWTAGTEDQTAWQIAYRKGTTFNPADTTLDWTTVTTVDVTTNPYTFVKTLDPASTYYMYVRANCDDGDYSEWCRKVCSFTTKAAAPAPTNFQKTDVGPDFATLTWKAGGGDYEANYDLYVVQSATTPATPTIDTVPTIAGITELPTAENPYLLDGLDNEKSYYAWVRANHVHPDTTMHSAWVAISGSYFTTLVNCPIPTTANATNLTPHTATLNWTGYSEEYNVRYRTAKSEDPIYSEDFEQGIPATWTLHAEGEVPTSVPNGWTTTTTDNGSTVAVSYSWLSGSGDMDADNWLITPSVSLQGMLKFDVRKYSAYYDEDYEVRLSTTGTEIADFTVVLRELDAAPSTWTEFSYDLSSYAGQQGYIAIRHNFSGGYNLMVDNFRIVNMIPAGEWTDATNPIAALTTDIQSLSDSTNYEWQVQATCAVDPENPEAGWSASGYFTTLDACTVPVADSVNSITYNSANLYWTGYQDEYNVRYRVYEIDSVTLYDNFDDGNANGWSRNDGGVYYWTGDYSDYFILLGEGVTTTQYLISPELSEYPEGSMVQFWHAGLDETEAVTFQVGYSSTTTELDAFTWGDEVTALIQDYDLFEEEIPAGIKYIAIKSTSPTEDACLFIDEFAVYNVLVPMGEWQYANNVTSPATITGLEDDTWYEWQVQGLGECTEGTDWSEGDYFETEKAYRQTIALTAGWNWISSNVVITMNDLKAALVEAVPGTAITIKSKNDGFTNYTGTKWKGTLSTIDLTQMYQVQVTSACEITLTGEPINPTDYPINIAPGANWIAFPFAESMTLTEAFAGFAMSGDNIKSKNDGFANYTNRWKGVLTNLVPGQGYIFTSPSSETRTFIYPVNRKTSAPKTGKKGVVRTSFDLKNFVFSKDATKISKTNLNKNKNNKQH